MNDIIQSASTLVDQVKESLKKDVFQAIRTTGPNMGIEAEILKVFDNFEDPFKKIQNVDLQMKYIRSNMKYVTPIEYKLGKRLIYRNKGSKRQISEKTDTMMFIPILDSIEQLLSNPRIFDMVVSKQKGCDPNVMYDICDGTLFRNNDFFQQHINSLQIILYHDEVEVCNPLGSHISTHKVDLYFTHLPI